MKLSIAMCTYNGALYLPEQLHSIAKQTRLPDELIVCDDGSDDDTREILAAFASKMPFIVRLYVNERNLGSTKNFEKAIALCEGDVILLSDQDDVWHPEKLMRIEAAFFSAPAAGLVFTDAQVVDHCLQPLGYSLWQRVGGKLNRAGQKQTLEKGEAFESLLTRNFVTGAALAFRSGFKELVLPIPSDTDLIHDGWIALMIAAVADLYFIDEPLIQYRQHPQQQVGAPVGEATVERKGDVLAAVRRENSYLREIHKLETVHQRLSAKCSVFSCREALPKLEARLTHLQARAHMPDDKLNRLPSVLKELLSFRYHLYSNGIRSAAKDLLI